MKCIIDRCKKRGKLAGMCRAHAKEFAPEAHAAYREQENARRSRPENLAKLRNEGLTEEQRLRRNERGVAKKKREREDERGPAQRARKRAQYHANPEPTRENAKFHGTGVSGEVAAAMRAVQGGICGICPRILELPNGRQGALYEHRDHVELLDGVVVPHKTPGAVKVPRGLLCGACNIALGYYENYQRPIGLVVQVYESYIANPPFAEVAGAFAETPRKKNAMVTQ